MASSVGPRARGTDGSDYLHRERVASHYTVSAEVKPKLKKVLLLQILCATVCLVISLMDQTNLVLLIVFTGYAVGIPLCHLSFKKNNATFMNIYGVCCSVLGVFPMVYLLYISMWTGAVTQHRYLKLFAAVAVVLCNTTGMFYAKKLMEAWTVAGTSKKS